MKFLIIAAFCSGLAVSGYGFTEQPPVKFGKVSKDEFGIKDFRGDSTVPAIVLCDYGEISISNRTFYKRHIRIKINNAEGLKYARFEFPYRFKEKHDDILAFKANAFQLAGGEILKFRYGMTQAKTEPKDATTKIKILELPGVKPGMIVEFSYEIASLDFITLDTWYFQREIPTLWSELRIDVPPPFYYLMTFQDGEFLTTAEQSAYADKLQWLYSANRFQRRARLGESNHILFESSAGNYRVYVLNNLKKKIVMKNLPGISSARGYLSVHDYYPKLRFDLFESSGNLPWIYRSLLLTTTEDYDFESRRQLLHNQMRQTGYVQYRLDTWTDFNEKLLKSEHFGLQLIRHFDYKPILDTSLANGMNEQEKMETVFNFVRNTIAWNGTFSMYPEKELKKVLEEGKGSSAGVNMLLIYLLRKAGLHADPVLIRTNDLGYPETVFPVHGQFNHTIALVNIGDEAFLLDAVSRDIPFTELPAPDLHTTGWRVSSRNFGWVDIALEKGIK